MDLDSHKFIHRFKSGKVLTMDIVREENKIPVFNTDDKLTLLTPADEIEYLYWVEYIMRFLIKEIFSDEELDLLAKLGNKYLCK